MYTEDPKWDIHFLKMAKLVSEMSKDPSTKVGAVITFNHVVLGTGFNGFPRLMTDKDEYLMDKDEKYSRTVHAEINVFIFAAGTLNGSTLYTYPFMPCERCAVQLIQGGIERFVAPQASLKVLERWGPSFEKATRYIDECGCVLRLYDREEIIG